jgi:ferredoxin
MTHQQLHIDWTVCRGRGLCTELLDGVLERDEWGFPRAAGHGSDVPIPRGSEGDAADAVTMCPLQALRLSMVD